MHDSTGVAAWLGATVSAIAASVLAGLLLWLNKWTHSTGERMAGLESRVSASDRRHGDCVARTTAQMNALATRIDSGDSQVIQRFEAYIHEVDARAREDNRTLATQLERHGEATQALASVVAELRGELRAWRKENAGSR